MANERSVVITGLGTVTPLGIGKDALWDGLVAGRSGLGKVTAFDSSHFPSMLGGEVPAFQINDYVPKSHRKSAKVMSRDIQLAVAAAYLAVKDAGLKTKCIIERGEAEGELNLDPTRFGANIGAGLICADLSELAGALATAVDENNEFSLTTWGKQGMENLTPLWLLKFLPNMLACHVTIVHDAQAPSNTLTCGEASSHLAIGEAFRNIARGSMDVAICGGAESKMNPMGMMRQQVLGRVVLDLDHAAESACRPFAPSATGTVSSEGGGLVTLESLDHAQKRGARAYAELVGFGATANTHSWSEPDPSGTGIARAIQAALKDAAITPGDIDLISTFGSGIPALDASEAAGLAAVFGTKLATIPCVATKGSIGTNGAGSGAIDLAVAVMCMANGTVPPSKNTDEAKARELRFVHGSPIDARVRYALSVGYALGGGQNAALVFKKPS